MTRNEAHVSNGKYWTQAEIDALELLRAQGKLFREIGIELKRSTASCRLKYVYERAGRGRIDNHKTVVQIHIPVAVLLERDRRSIAPRSLSAQFFGDPPQGFSALDRMQHGRTL